MYRAPFFLLFTSGRELLSWAGDECTNDVVEILTMTYNAMGSIFRTAKNKPNRPQNCRINGYTYVEFWRGTINQVTMNTCNLLTSAGPTGKGVGSEISAVSSDAGLCFQVLYAAATSEFSVKSFGLWPSHTVIFWVPIPKTLHVWRYTFSCQTPKATL